jgi:hypothetical protein
MKPEDFTKFQEKYSHSYLNELTFAIFSLILQQDYLRKSLRQVFETNDVMREGKIPYETFMLLIHMNTNGNGLDLWLTRTQVNLLLSFTNPRLTSEYAGDEKIDYNALLFCLEKP